MNIRHKVIAALSSATLLGGVLGSEIWMTNRAEQATKGYVDCKNLIEGETSVLEPEIACAAQWSEHPKVEQLASSGADVNARDEYGLTPLMRANDLKTARILLAHNTDIKAVDNEGKNVLGTGFFGGAGLVYVQIFLWNGADPYRKDNDGDTMYSRESLNKRKVSGK